MINPYGTFMKFWNFLIIVLLIYNGLVIPPRLAFDDESGINWLYVDLTIDSIFWTDIIVNFLTAFEDAEGQVICTHREIAINYLTGWFAIDISSSFPLYLVINQSPQQQTSGGSSNYNNMIRLSSNFFKKLLINT